MPLEDPKEAVCPVPLELPFALDRSKFVLVCAPWLAAHLGAVEGDCLGNDCSPAFIKGLLHDSIVCPWWACIVRALIRAFVLLTSMCMQHDSVWHHNIPQYFIQGAHYEK